MRHSFLIAVLVACGGNRVEDSGSAAAGPPPPPTATSSTPPTAPPPTTPNPPAKASMTTFMPTLKFREHAATALGIPVAEVEGGPADATDAADTGRPNTINGAWSVVVHPKGNHQREYRGWVMADGTVITADQNLGRLLAEVGLWVKGRTQSDDDIADKVAALVAWSYGYGYKVIDYRRNGMTPPTLTLQPDGSGELVFFTDYKAPGPGGAGGGPSDFTEHRIAFKPDKTASLAKTKK